MISGECNEGENVAITRYSAQATDLAVSIKGVDGMRMPRPDHYRTASNLLANYFQNYVSQGDEDLFNIVIDRTYKSLHHFMLRDYGTRKVVAMAPFGEHAADAPLNKAATTVLAEHDRVTDSARTDDLAFARMHLGAVHSEAAESRPLSVDPTQSSLLQASRLVRTRLVDAIRTGVRPLEFRADTITARREVGHFAALSLFSLADAVAWHERDFEYIPLEDLVN